MKKILLAFVATLIFISCDEENDSKSNNIQYFPSCKIVKFVNYENSESHYIYENDKLVKISHEHEDGSKDTSFITYLNDEESVLKNEVQNIEERYFHNENYDIYAEPLVHLSDSVALIKSNGKVINAKHFRFNKFYNNPGNWVLYNNDSLFYDNRGNCVRLDRWYKLENTESDSLTLNRQIEFDYDESPNIRKFINLPFIFWLKISPFQVSENNIIGNRNYSIDENGNRTLIGESEGGDYTYNDRGFFESDSYWYYYYECK